MHNMKSRGSIIPMSIKITINHLTKSGGSHPNGIIKLYVLLGDHASDTKQTANISDDDSRTFCAVGLASTLITRFLVVVPWQRKWRRKIPS